jgi:hypothetical protein
VSGQARILETIAEAVPQGRVILDLTHGFRHLAAIGASSAFFHQQDRKPAEEAFEAEIRAREHPRAVADGYWMLKNLRNALAHGNPSKSDDVRQIIANPKRLPVELDKAMQRVLG